MKASVTAFSFTRPRSSWIQVMLQDAQDLESEPEVKMDDIMSDDTLDSGLDQRDQSGRPIVVLIGMKTTLFTTGSDSEWTRLIVDISPTTTIARS